MNRRSLYALVAMLMVASMLTACEVEDPATLEIAGSYNDDYAAAWEITEEVWSMQYDEATDVSYFTVTSYSNELEYAVAQNDPENEWNAGLWSRFDWTYDGDDLYICQSVIDGETEEAADGAEPADSADLTTGCSGFPWSILTAIE